MKALRELESAQAAGGSSLDRLRAIAQARRELGRIDGQFYIAILVAGLVGAYISGRQMGAAD